MARGFNNTWYYNDTPLVAGFPFSAFAWFYSTRDDLRQTLFYLGDKDSTSNFHRLELLGTSTGDPVSATTVAGGGATNAQTTVGYTPNVWQNALGVWAGESDRRVYLNGGSKGIQTGTRAWPTGVDRFALANMGDGAGSRYLVGALAEMAVWDTALSDEDALMLAAGFCPLLVRPGSLVSYYPLVSELVDRVGGLALTASGSPSVEAHPRIFTPALTRGLKLAAPASSVTLTVQDAAQVQTADSPDLSQTHLLTAQDAAQAQAADNPALVQTHGLLVQDAAQAQAAEGVSLSQVHVLAAQDAVQSQTAESVTLSTEGSVMLAVQGGLHPMTSDSPVLTQVHVLMVQDALQGMRSEVVTFLGVGRLLRLGARPVQLHCQTRTGRLALAERDNQLKLNGRDMRLKVSDRPMRLTVEVKR